MRIRDNKRKQVIVQDTFMYIPILKTLETIVSCMEFSKYFNQPSDSVLGVYENYRDSNSFKNNPLFLKNQNALQIQLFYDDFETVNPLGSKKGYISWVLYILLYVIFPIL